jgi:hypothetical protein
MIGRLKRIDENWGFRRITMSTWRKEASNRLPELQSIIASREIDNAMGLWIELRLKFSTLCKLSPQPLDLLKRIWEYALWCMEHGNDDVGTAAAFGFCEHLLDSKASQLLLPKIMSRAKFEECKDLLLYHNTLQEYEQALKQFNTRT